MIAGLAFAGCDRTAVVRGTVVDVSGEALPGVAVAVRDQDAQTTSNELGAYQLRCVPGDLSLTLMKTGYTPGYLTVTAVSGATEVTQARLWPLPIARGVYLFENYRYLEIDRTEPKRYVTREFGLVHAVKKDISFVTELTQPTIICFKMPVYDVQLHQMKEVEASDAELETPNYAQRVWAPVRALPISARPIDEPEHLLVELRLDAPLEPGAYGVHWGALQGYAGTDSRVFLFRVVPPEEKAAAEQAAKEAPEEEAAAETPPATQVLRTGEDTDPGDGW